MVSIVRYPQLKLVVNGVPIDSAVSARITSTSYFCADSFAVTVVTGQTSVTGNAYWSSQSKTLIEIQLSNDGGMNFTSLITGRVDSVALHPQFDIVKIEGRDLTADLLSSSAQDSFVNRTSREIINDICERHGLKAAISGGDTIVGEFDSWGRTLLSLNRSAKSTTDWDVLVCLARSQQCDLFFEGATLYFQPTVLVNRKSIVISPENVKNLRLVRRLPLSANYQVTVKSWNAWQQQAFISTQSASQGSEGPVDTAPPQLPVSSFTLSHPNLTSEDTDAILRSQIAEIAFHERTVEFELPGELSITPRDVVVLEGTNTSFDQQYRILSIDRMISSNAGFVEHVTATNASQ